MIESTYCILLALLILMFVLSFGFFLYQKLVFGIAVNEISEEIAMTYKLRNSASSSAVTESDVENIGKYRYLLFSDGFNSKNISKAVNIACLRLSNASLAKDEGSISVSIQPVVDDIGRRHYAVTVRQKYTFLLGDMLRVIGLDGSMIFEKTSYVEGMDVLHYYNTVKTTKYGIKKIKSNSSLLKLVDSVISLVESVLTFGSD